MARKKMEYHRYTWEEKYNKGDAFTKLCMIAKYLGITYGELQVKIYRDGLNWQEEGERIIAETREMEEKEEEEDDL